MYLSCLSDLDNYALCLGKLWGNFLSLEFSLRVFLSNLPNASSRGVAYGKDIYSLLVGAELPESQISNQAYFSALVKAFNDEVTRSKTGETIDSSLIDLRNSLAHGLVSAAAEGTQLRILKFSMPSKGTGLVKIVTNEVMDELWFKKQIPRIHAAIMTVKAAHDCSSKTHKKG